MGGGGGGGGSRGMGMGFFERLMHLLMEDWLITLTSAWSSLMTSS